MEYIKIIENALLLFVALTVAIIIVSYVTFKIRKKKNPDNNNSKTVEAIKVVIQQPAEPPKPQPKKEEKRESPSSNKYHNSSSKSPSRSSGKSEQKRPSSHFQKNRIEVINSPIQKDKTKYPERNELTKPSEDKKMHSLGDNILDKYEDHDF